MTNEREEEFLRQAKMARQRAATADGEFRVQWIKVAEMWELLAHEQCGELRQAPNKSG
jgi:hypothetical protein